MLSKEQTNYLLKLIFTDVDIRTVAPKEIVLEWLKDKEFRKKYFIVLDILESRTTILIENFLKGEIKNNG